jgi:limonene-1,2-epoxide hydrolase
MESPIEVVRRFCAAWSEDMGADELAAFFTDGAIYQQHPGRAGRRQEGGCQDDRLIHPPRPPGIEGIEFRIINIAANGPIVITLTRDTVPIPGGLDGPHPEVF